MASSIPLPALHVQGPDPNSGLNNIAQLYQIMREKALLPGQIQAQQQNLASGAADVQLKQQQLANQQAGLKAMQEWDGKDPNDLVGLYAKHGADANTVINLKNNIIKQKQDLANLDKDTLANQAAANDQLIGHLDAIQAGADPKVEAGKILTSGIVKDPGTLQAVQAIASGQTVPTSEQLDLMKKGLTAHSKQLEEAKNEAQAKEATARAGEAGAQQKKIETEINPANPADQNIARQKYQGILQTIQTKGIGAVPPEDLTWARAHEAAETKRTVQSDTLGVTSTNTSGPAGLSTVGASRGRPPAVVPPANAVIPPSGGGAPTPGPKVPAAAGTVPPASASTATSTRDSLVDTIGQYKYNPANLSRLIVKHPELIAQVNAKYPDWSQSNYNAINKAVTDLAPSGKTGQQITSYNTFLRHAGALYDAVNSLDNSKYSDLLNKPINWLTQHTGDPRVADFMAAIQPPMKEFQSFLLNNHAMHDEDVKDAHSLIDVDKTPQEIRAVLKRFAETGSARLTEQNESFKRVTGKDIPNLVSPAAAAAYNKITGAKFGEEAGAGAGGGKEIHYKIVNGQLVPQ